MCMVRPRGTTKKIIPKDMLQNAINESRWDPKTCSHSAQKIKEREIGIRTRKKLILNK